MKILIVDDEVNLVDILDLFIEDEFEDIGIETLSANSGNAAIEILKKEDNSKILLIISDLKMDDGTGLDLHNFNKDHHNIPFYLASGEDLEGKDFAASFLQSNEKNKLIEKPYDLDELEVLIKELIPKE